MAETFSSRSWYHPTHSKCKSYVLIKNTNKWQVAKHLYRKNLQTTTLISLISTHTTHNHTSFASRLYFVVLNTNNLKDTRTWWGQMSWLFYSGHACMRMRWTLGCENIKKLTFPKHFYNVFILKPVNVISVTIWKQFAITLWKCFDVNTIDASKG